MVLVWESQREKPEGGRIREKGLACAGSPAVIFLGMAGMTQWGTMGKAEAWAFQEFHF